MIKRAVRFATSSRFEDLCHLLCLVCCLLITNKRFSFSQSLIFDVVHRQHLIHDSGQRFVHKYLVLVLSIFKLREGFLCYLFC